MFDIVSLGIGAAVGAVAGAFVMASVAGARVKAMREQCDADMADRAALAGSALTLGEQDAVAMAFARNADLRAESDRCAALNDVSQRRIAEALDCVTPNSAHVGKKMAKILRGDA